MSAFDSSKHDRDRTGRFAEMAGSEQDDALGAPATVDSPDVRCACARNRDGSRTTMLCPTHADQDPCLTMAQVTGRRRKGTIRNGVCTNCGWRQR